MEFCPSISCLHPKHSSKGIARMPKYIYLVRHGECKANVDGVIAGAGDDSPLTELGKQQAVDAAKNLNGIQFDLIVTSPMTRAKDTAEIIANELGFDKAKIVPKIEFNEKEVGEFSGKPKEEYFAFEKSGGEAGETTTDMQERVRSGIDWLKQQNFQNALLVTHNGTVRMIRTVLEHLSAKEFANMPQLANGEFLKIDLEHVEA